MSGFSKRFLYLLILLPLAGWCGEAVIATVSGEVRLNDRPLLRSSAVFAGDVLETVADSAVVLQGKHFAVQIGPNAVSVLESKALLLRSGDLQGKGLVNIRAGGIAIYSDSVDTKFLVSRGLRTVTIKVSAGTVVVRTSTARVMMNRGQSRTFDDIDAATTMATRNGKKLSIPMAVGTGASAGAIIAAHLKDGEPADASNGRLASGTLGH